MRTCTERNDQLEHEVSEMTKNTAVANDAQSKELVENYKQENTVLEEAIGKYLLYD